MVDYNDVIKVLSKLSGDPVQAYRLLGERAIRAWELLGELRVKKYVFKPSGKVQWIVVGKEREYIIYPDVGYCHCEDFYFHIMEGKAYACQHLIARKLAESLEMYDMVEEGDELYYTLIDEWRKIVARKRLD